MYVHTYYTCTCRRGGEEKREREEGKGGERERLEREMGEKWLERN